MSFVSVVRATVESVTTRILTVRELGRATLARQHLLRRSDLSVTEMLEHLIGLQAQAPEPPYYALWTRMRGFTPGRLSDLLESRRVVRIALMRGTVFAVTSSDALALRPWVQPLLTRALHTDVQYAAGLAGIDHTALATLAGDLVRHAPRTVQELGVLLTEHFPGHDPRALAFAVRGLLPLVQIPPRGLWGRSGRPRLTLLEHWIGRDSGSLPPGATEAETLVRRYLAAFGPASVRDAQAWSGLPRLGEIFDALRPELVVFRDEKGGELFDLPDAPRPDASTPAPVRILAQYDNVVLSHADRSRLISDADRRRLVTKNGIVHATALVGGTVSASVRRTTTRQSATLEVTPWRRLSTANRSAIEAEGMRLLKFSAPGAQDHEVRILPEAEM
ncbi:Uncharacterised protein [Rhodococcus coprophilus]|uniref:Winged helix DNA-binding domain-containing protein n=1 Tax=Rhodococcus coprophilus TaxID=38310 RepID=A0A2X4U4T4_9NOCA|nr:Uncharacterised protein [Rhodococcus coprophilus]